MAGEFDDFGVTQEDFDLAKAAIAEESPFGEYGAPLSRGTPTGFFDKGVVAGQGATRGALQGTGAAAGALAGMEAGGAAGALTGPFAPVLAPVGATVGAAAGGVLGFMAGDKAADGLATVYLPGSNQPMTFENIAAVPEALRPYAVAGETLGNAALPTAPFIVSKGGVKFADNLISRFVTSSTDTAKKYPLSFALVESQLAFGAAAGAGAAETLAPGSDKTRMFGEVVGGLLNPAATATKSARYGVQFIKNVASNFSEDAQQSIAGTKLRAILQEFGEDPNAVIDKLRGLDSVLGSSPEGKALTAGQKSGSEGLIELENALRQTSQQFDRESAQKGKDGLEFMRTAIKLLNEIGTSSGDQNALKAAAQMQQLYYDNLIEGTRRQAEHNIVEALAYFDPASAISRRELGERAAGIISESMDQVRRVERQLWEAVPDQPAGVDSLINAYGRIRGTQRLESETLPPLIEKEIGKFAEARANDHVAGGSGQVSTLKYLQKFRSRMLGLSREAAGKGEWADARAYGELAEAALDDMTGNGTIDNPALTAARDWSRTLHERFTQTFAGDAIKRADDGGMRLPPEMMMMRAFGSGKEMSELQFRQLQEAAHMAGNEYTTRMLGVQEQFLHKAAADLFANGKVNGTRLRSWRTQNAELLRRFPEIDRRLQNAEGAQQFFEHTEDGIATVKRQIKEDTALAKLLANADPANAIGDAIQGRNPIEELNGIWRIARGSNNPDAIAAAERGLWSYIYDRSVKQSGDFSFTTYGQILSQPVTPGQPPLKDVLVNSGMVGQGHMNDVVEILARATELESAMANRTGLDTVIDDTGALWDVVYGIMGAKMAANVPGKHNSLTIAAAMKRAVRQVFDRIPKAKVKELLVQAVRDPEFAAMLLEKSSDPRRRVEWAQQMNTYLWQAGIGGWTRTQLEDQGYSE
jgi:hypothetical protein